MMRSFKEFVEQKRFVNFITDIVNEYTINKPWSASKTEVLQIWKNLQPNLPIYIMPIEDSKNKISKKGRSTYANDGIRITGSWQFIASIMSRLKELINWENPDHRLRLVFKGADPSKQPNRQVFAFYVNLEKRGKSVP